MELTATSFSWAPSSPNPYFAERFNTVQPAHSIRRNLVASDQIFGHGSRRTGLWRCRGASATIQGCGRTKLCTPRLARCRFVGPAWPRRTFSHDAAGTKCCQTHPRVCGQPWRRLRRRHSSHRNPANRGIVDRFLWPEDVPAGDRRCGGHIAGKPLSPLRIEGSDPRRVGPAVLHRFGSHRPDRPRKTGQAGLAIRRRQDRRTGIRDRTLCGRPSRRSADVVLRSAERKSGACRTPSKPAHGRPAGDAANAARRKVERLHQIRHRPSDAGRPDLPDHDARRTRHHPPHRGGRPDRARHVPHHVARSGQSATQRQRTE